MIKFARIKIMIANLPFNFFGKIIFWRGKIGVVVHRGVKRVIETNVLNIEDDDYLILKSYSHKQ